MSQLIPLTELVARHNQVHVAHALGVSPAAISKAIAAERAITVTVHDDGRWEAVELRPFPSQTKPAA